MTLRIIGAGMAGLLAANMLKHRDPVVIEAQPSLPNNHSAVLRFSSSLVSDVLGIPFKKVNLVKDVIPWRNKVADALAYSYKCFGEYRSDRSVALPERMTTSERWIAPENLIEIMAKRCVIQFDNEFDFTVKSKEKVLSTIPMPVLLKSLNDCPYAPRFKYVQGYNVRAKIAYCDAYASIYVPDPEIIFSRASITGDELIVEIPTTSDFRALPVSGTTIAEQACDLFGIKGCLFRKTIEVHHQTYAKISPIDEDMRKNIIHWVSATRGVAWQLGRFATWRPGLLLDDLIKDVRKIDGWISSPSAGYEMEMHR